MEQLFNVEDSARILAISPWTIRALLRRGKLRPIRIGRRVCVSENELRRFVEEAQVKLPTEGARKDGEGI
jgi:excisionase family DNA binding protein